jgi:hypothetical protein
VRHLERAIRGSQVDRLNNICDVCKTKGFVYEKKVVDETFLLCEDCDWSTEDIKIANRLGNIFINLLQGIKRAK